MVFVKVREVYDLHTITNKMSIITIHTPKADIIKRNFPGLLMQCKAYRPHSCTARVACASVMPLDPAGVGLSGDGVVAPEDLFNPILYKATSNFGMSQIEARVAAMSSGGYYSDEVNGSSALVDNNNVTDQTDEFAIYYGLLSDAHGWRHASPQSGFEMNDLRPLVYEMVYNVGDNRDSANASYNMKYDYPGLAGGTSTQDVQAFRGNSKPMPWLNCTSFSSSPVNAGFGDATTNNPPNHQLSVPAPNVTVGVIIVPPSRLHELYYRMVVEWTLEFSGIKSFQEVVAINDLAQFGNTQHYSTYSYENTSKALGVEESALVNETDMVSTNTDIKKVM